MGAHGLDTANYINVDYIKLAMGKALAMVRLRVLTSTTKKPVEHQVERPPLHCERGRQAWSILDALVAVGRPGITLSGGGKPCGLGRKGWSIPYLPDLVGGWAGPWRPGGTAEQDTGIAGPTTGRT